MQSSTEQDLLCGEACCTPGTVKRLEQAASGVALSFLQYLREKEPVGFHHHHPSSSSYTIIHHHHHPHPHPHHHHHHHLFNLIHPITHLNHLSFIHIVYIMVGTVRAEMRQLPRPPPCADGPTVEGVLRALQRGGGQMLRRRVLRRHVLASPQARFRAATRGDRSRFSKA